MLSFVCCRAGLWHLSSVFICHVGLSSALCLNTWPVCVCFCWHIMFNVFLLSLAFLTGNTSSFHIYCHIAVKNVFSCDFLTIIDGVFQQTVSSITCYCTGLCCLMLKMQTVKAKQTLLSLVTGMRSVALLMTCALWFSAYNGVIFVDFWYWQVCSQLLGQSLAFSHRRGNDFLAGAASERFLG